MELGNFKPSSLFVFFFDWHVICVILVPHACLHDTCDFTLLFFNVRVCYAIHVVVLVGIEVSV